MEAFVTNGWAKATYFDLIHLLAAYNTQTDSFVVDAMCASLSSLLKFFRASALADNVRYASTPPLC